MAPVLMTVVMTVSIEWIPKDETGDRLSVLMTLFLALCKLSSFVSRPLHSNFRNTS